MKSFKILNSKKVKLLILMSLVLSLTLGVYLYTGKEIKLDIDGEVTETVSYAKTVGELLEKEEMKVEEGAYINLPLDTELQKDLSVKVINPMEYTIRQKDDIKRVRSTSTNVQTILDGAGIELGELDYTEPAGDAEIEENETIKVFRVMEETVVDKSYIDFEKKRENTDSLFKGQEKLKQSGKKGVKATSIKKRYVNDELITEEVVKEEVTKEVKDSIVLVGTKEKPKPKPEPKPEPKAKETANRGGTTRSKATPSKQSSKPASNKQSKPKSSGNSSSSSSSNKPANVSNTMVMQATAYSHSEPGLSTRTANGTNLLQNPRVIAVDPNVIPLGTRVNIAGYGTYIAADTGGAIKGNRIDIHFNTVQECINFGRRNVKVEILR